MPEAAARADDDADDDRAGQPARAGGVDLERAQLPGSAAMLTGRAGTTVEMACL
jgi:hypothetical protein